MGGFNRGHETYEIPYFVSSPLTHFIKTMDVGNCKGRRWRGEGRLTLPQIYDPENKANANQRKMNDVIDNPTH